eukprot:8691882-Prorocentrum_lima.AAC.1
MRHTSTGKLWVQPAFGEVVAVTRPGPNKALGNRGQAGHYLYSQSWTKAITHILVTDNKGRKNVKHGL